MHLVGAGVSRRAAKRYLSFRSCRPGGIVHGGWWTCFFFFLLCLVFLVAAGSRQQEQEVKCDDTHTCSDSSTCCKTQTGSWGCCPLPRVNIVHRSHWPTIRLKTYNQQRALDLVKS
uniref:Granulins domain-containing protein n=1 Tax=Hippocampus comes TaxID=109280 RepID=A0A3Q2Y090_HIPCM